MDKVRVIEGSLRCFRLGLASLVPVIGLAFAVFAMFEAQRVRQAVGNEWNPVRAYLRGGRALATLGLLISLIAVIILVRVLLSNGF
jgi:hypothetical protein